MTRAIAGAVVIGAAAAACFSTPTRPLGGDAGVTGDGRLIDGRYLDAMLNVDGSLANCDTESFAGSGSGTCGLSMWANMQAASGMAYLTNTSAGELRLNLLGGTTSFVNCTSGSAAWNRITVDVQDVATTGPNNRTFVGLQSVDGTKHWGLEFSDSSGSAAYTPVCDGTVVSPVAPVLWLSLKNRYVKIERTMPDEVTISTSEDNIGFDAVTSCTPLSTTLDTTQAQLRVYTTSVGSGTAQADIAAFGFIELCHD